MFYYNSNYDQIRWAGVVIACLVFMVKFWRSFTNNRVITNDGTWDANDLNNCIEFKRHPFTDVLECNKRYGSGAYFYLGMSIFFLVIAVLIVFIWIWKYLYSRTQQSNQESPRRQEWALERPVVAISTVSRDYGIRNTTNTNPSAPPSHIIVLSPSETVAEADAPPSEYLPPPEYNEFVINVRDYNYDRGLPSSSRII